MEKPTVGGQAVIEGVMMRSPKRVATCVRNPDGEIEIQNNPFTPVTKRYKILGIPIVRGAVSLIEMLTIGIKTLNWSADIAFPEEKEKGGIMDSIGTFFAFGIAILIFVYTPLLLSQLAGLKDNPALFNLLAGGIRLLFFLVYLIVISMFKDVRRVFEYHGAEHKAIHAYEQGLDLTLENVRENTTLHPRCGTSFILIVALASIVFFAIADSIFYYFTGYLPKSIGRFGFHLALWPLMAGLAYEILKFSDRASRKWKIFRIFVMPGLWLQKITTKEPDDSQLETAIMAIKESLKDVEDAG